MQRTTALGCGREHVRSHIPPVMPHHAQFGAGMIGHLKAAWTLQRLFHLLIPLGTAKSRWSPEITNHSQCVCKQCRCTQHLNGLGARYIYSPLSFTPVVILQSTYLSQASLKTKEHSVGLRPTSYFTVPVVSVLYNESKTYQVNLKKAFWQIFSHPTCLLCTEWLSSVGFVSAF